MYDYATFGFLLSAIVGASVGTWLVVRNEARGPGFAFGAFMLVMGWWSATHVAYLASTAESWLLVFTKLSYVGVVLTPIAWLSFALVYADRREWLSRRRLAALCVVPALTLGFVFTAEHHSLFYESIALADAGGRPSLETEPGPWHAVNIAYSYALLAIATGLLVKSALTSNRRYRRQSAVLLVCVLAPWFVNAGYHLGIRPVPSVDPTPLAFTIVGIPLAAIVLRTDLTTFVPVAHERVFRTLDDPMLVIGSDDRVLDANDRARAVLGGDEPIEGASIDAILPNELLEGGALSIASHGGVSCAIDVDGERRRFLARRRDVDPDSGSGARGTIVSLTDLTVQLNQRDALAEKNDALEAQTAQLELKNEQLERLASVVSHDLATPLATAESLLHLVRADLERGGPTSNREVARSVEDLETVHERLREFAETLPRLARESTDVESPVECDLETVARTAWDVVETEDLELAIESTGTIRADPRRLRQALENLFRNAAEHGSTSPDSQPRRDAVEYDDRDDATGAASTREAAIDADPASAGTIRAARRGDDRPDEAAAKRTVRTATTVRVGSIAPRSSRATTRAERDDAESTDRGDGEDERDETRRRAADRSGFYVEDDGPGIPPARREDVLEFGVSTGSGAGYGLAIVRTIAEAHGWSLAIADSRDGGARFEFHDVGCDR